MSVLMKDKQSKSSSSFFVTTTRGDGDVTVTPSHLFQRPSSPVISMRIDEKNQLASLNDRLATYIERVRRLESDNEQLIKITADIEETTRRERNGVKLMYSAEISEARRLLDQMAIEKAKFQLEAGRFQSELDDLQPKLAIKEKAETNLKQKLIVAESDIAKMQSRLDGSAAQRRQTEADNVRLFEELDSCKKELVVVKKNLEAETLRRIDLENRNKTLQEEIVFQAQIHRKELDEMASLRRIEREQINREIQQEYDNRWSEALHQMRDENNAHIVRSRAEVEAMYDSKLSEGLATAQKYEESASRTQSELRRTREQCEALATENARLNSQVEAGLSRIDTLEQHLRLERDEHWDSLSGKNAEIQQLKKTVEDQLIEYRDLLDIKIQLDSEIATYRKLLELEESRLNTSSETTPSKSDEALRSRKRKIVDIQKNVSSAGESGVEIDSVDPQGSYVRLVNKTNKTVNIRGWTLTQTNGSDERTYEFPPRTFIKAHQVLTIRSAEGTPSQGMELIMQSKSWLTNHAIETKLSDSKGEEVFRHSSRLHFSSPSGITSPSSVDLTSVDEQDSGVELTEVYFLSTEVELYASHTGVSE